MLPQASDGGIKRKIKRRADRVTETVPERRWSREDSQDRRYCMRLLCVDEGVYVECGAGNSSGEGKGGRKESKLEGI